MKDSTFLQHPKNCLELLKDELRDLFNYCLFFFVIFQIFELVVWFPTFFGCRKNWVSTRPSVSGCGLAWSSGVFRQLVHAKQLKSAGYIKGTEGWEYPGEEKPKVKKDEVLEVVGV